MLIDLHQSSTQGQQLAIGQLLLLPAAMSLKELLIEKTQGRRSSMTLLAKYIQHNHNK